MAIYYFTLTETYEKSVSIEAASEDEAREIFEDEYMAGEITTDPADDFVEWDLFLIHVED